MEEEKSRGGALLVQLRQMWPKDPGRKAIDRLGRDDNPLSALKGETIQLFSELCQPDERESLRSTWPEEAMVGDPWMISCSDRSRFGTGEVGYVRWEPKNNGYGSRIMLKLGKIGPKSQSTTS